MKKTLVLLMTILLLCLTAGAVADNVADNEVELKPGPDDLTIEEVHARAAAFFSVKCGIPFETLQIAQMNIRLLQHQSLRNINGKNVYVADEAAKWQVHVKTFPGYNGQHRGFHLLYLSRNGDLMYWQAHGAHYEAGESEDIMLCGTEVTPLPSDIQESAVIEKMKEEMEKEYGLAPEKFSYQAKFLFEKHFNSGEIPVWIVYAYSNGAVAWKAAYGYDGSCMSLTPAQQDYTSYNTEDQIFFESVYEDDWYDQTHKLFKLSEGKLSQTEAEACLAEWKPLFEAWCKTHPWAANSQLLTPYFQNSEKSSTP